MRVAPSHITIPVLDPQISSDETGVVRGQGCQLMSIPQALCSIVFVFRSSLVSGSLLFGPLLSGSQLANCWLLCATAVCCRMLSPCVCIQCLSQTICVCVCVWERETSNTDSTLHSFRDACQRWRLLMSSSAPSCSVAIAILVCVCIVSGFMCFQSSFSKEICV